MTTSVSSQCQVISLSYSNPSSSDLCRSTESDCPPRYCGSPTPMVKKPAGVSCQCDQSCTGESNTTFGAQCLLAEPFEFGAWNETRECDKSCFLKMERHCEPVVLSDDMKPLPCKEQNITMTGKTRCSSCKGELFVIRNQFLCIVIVWILHKLKSISCVCK